MFSFPRYLAAFDPKSVPHHFVDVLIVGGGLAGLRAAIEIDPELRVLIVTKDALQQSSSVYAQGGIAGVIKPDDCFENHVEDTLIAGCNLCDREIVEMVVREAPQRIEELIRWGASFDENAGELALGKEGGHSHHRIVHANGDATCATLDAHAVLCDGLGEFIGHGQSDRLYNFITGAEVVVDGAAGHFCLVGDVE